MKRLAHFLLGFAVLLMVNCEESEESPVEKPVSKETVYLVGTKDLSPFTGANQITCVINDTLFLPLFSPMNGWYAFDFFTDGTDSYLLGFRWSKSMVWKNGILLNDTSSWDRYSAMEVANGTVYVAGWGTVLRETPTLWKNNFPILLPFTDPSFDNGRGYDVAVSGTNEYVVGYEFDVHGATNWNALIWKNGVPTILSKPVSHPEAARPLAVAVSGTDVHAVGFGFAPNGSPGAIYWKNGEPTALEYPFSRENISWATDIVVNNGDVHIVGYDTYGEAIYWKNGVAFELPKSDTNPDTRIWDVSSIFLYEGDVYVSGSEDAGRWHAIYWKNGVPTVIDSLTTGDRIFVTPPRD